MIYKIVLCTYTSQLEKEISEQRNEIRGDETEKYRDEYKECKIIADSDMPK